MIGRTLSRLRVLPAVGTPSAAESVSFSTPLPTVELASTEQKEARGKCELSKFENGLMVGSMETDSAVCSLNIFVRAGSRYEQHSERGVAHFLRRMAFRSTKSNSIIHMSRMPELLGSSVWATSGREMLNYSTDCLQDNAGEIFKILESTVVEPAHYHWEVRDMSQKVGMDTAAHQLDPTSVVLDHVHRLAFRNGLGNSLCCPEHCFESVTEATLNSYHNRMFVAPRMAVVGVGIAHNDLLQIVGESGLIKLKSGPAETDQASIFTPVNQEVRLENNNESVVGALVAKGASLTSDQLLTAEVLQRVLGTGVQIQHGCNAATSRITRASEKARAGGAKVTTINFNYSDSGLFGILVSAKKDTIRPCMKAAWEEVVRTAGKVEKNELARAKAQVKADLLRSLETRAEMAEDIGFQFLLRGKYQPVQQAVEIVDGITADQVAKFAKTVVTSPRSMALTGDLQDAPYLNDLLA